MAKKNQKRGARRHYWVKQTELGRSNTLPPASTFDEKEELKLLRREVKRLREERYILKKATVFFAKESR